MSKMLRTFFAGTTAALIASVVFAQAAATDSAATQPKAEQARKSVFQKMDKNSDGKVTKDEHQAGLNEWFKEMDKNGDGKLSPDEFSGARFVEMDIDRDGTVTLEEYLVFFVGKDALALADKTPASDTLYPKDANEITGAEVIAYRKSVFKAVNAGNNGKSTPDEVKAYTDKQFDFLDKNKDGFITEDEITAVMVLPVFATEAKSEAVEKKAAAPAEK